ncbi:unnamed protein product [Closterium sp. NIES-65]|nr:unnamed protein product [Closterium sp. NIES-65]
MGTCNGSRSSGAEVRSGVAKSDRLDLSASDTVVAEAEEQRYRVAEAVAQRYGVAKRDLLDSSASDIAVWLALGEAHIVADTKRALLDAADIHVSLMEQFATAALQALHSVFSAPCALPIRWLK